MHENKKRRKSWRKWLQTVAICNSDVDIESYLKPYIKYYPEKADNAVYPRTVGGYWSKTPRKTNYSFMGENNRHNVYGYRQPSCTKPRSRSAKTTRNGEINNSARLSAIWVKLNNAMRNRRRRLLKCSMSSLFRN